MAAPGISGRWLVAGNRVLMVPYGHSLGRVGRLLQIARCLRQQGQEVTFAGDGDHLAFARRDGFPLIPLLELDRELVASKFNRASISFHTVSSAERFVAQEIALLREVRPDCTVADFRPTLRISTAALGVPYVSVTNASYVEYYSERRRAPRTHPLVRMIPGRAIYLLEPIVPLLNRLYARPYNAVLARYKLPPIRRVERIFAGDLTLLADVPEFAPSAGLPPGYHYVGPLLWEPECQLPAWIEQRDRAQPLVYGTVGGTGGLRLAQAALQAFENAPYQVVMTAGGRAGEVTGAPGKVRLERFLPGRKVLALSQAMVCHGGIGSIYQGLEAGVPIVGVPFNLEQEWNVDRLVDLGLGLKLEAGRQTAERLRQAVDTLLSTPDYGDRARGFSRYLEPYPGAEKAGELIRRFLETGRAVRR
jgi:UDP:flavonoid glycosyltransferase YjiC (YdhE family)